MKNSFINNVHDIERLAETIKSDSSLDGKLSVINLNWACSFKLNIHNIVKRTEGKSYSELDDRIEKATKLLLEYCKIEKFVFRFENDNRDYIHFFRNTKFEFLVLNVKNIHQLDIKEKETISIILQHLKVFHLNIIFDEKSIEIFKFMDFKPMFLSKNFKILNIDVTKLTTQPIYILTKLVKAAVVYTKAEVHLNGLILVYFALELKEIDKDRVKYDNINSVRDFYLVLKKYGCQVVHKSLFFTIDDEPNIFEVHNILSVAIRAKLKINHFVFNKLTKRRRTRRKSKRKNRYKKKFFDLEIVDTFMKNLIKNLVQLPTEFPECLV